MLYGAYPQDTQLSPEEEAAQLAQQQKSRRYAGADDPAQDADALFDPQATACRQCGRVLRHTTRSRCLSCQAGEEAL